MRWIVRAVAAALVLLVLAWSALHWFIVPRIDDFRPRLEALATRALGAPVTIGALRVESNALVPSVSVHDLSVQAPDGTPGLQVPRALVVFSLSSLLQGGLEQLVIDAPELELRRTPAGRLLAGGIDLSGDAAADSRAADWIFAQKEIVVRGGRLRWVDALRAQPPVALDAVNVVLRGSRWRHQWRVDATPEPEWGERFTLIGRFRQPLLSLHAGRWQEWDGQLYASLPRLNAGQWPRLVDLERHWGVTIAQGQGALRLWMELRRGAATAVSADLALSQVAVRLAPKLAPLELATLSTRLDWRALEGGFELGTRGLQFSETKGLAWPGGNVLFSQRDGSLGAVGGGSLDGDRLDLTALARIASRLPLPSEAGAPLAQLRPTGLIERVQARWSGTLQAPSNWQLQARVAGLALAAQPAERAADGAEQAGVPGIEGATLQLQARPTGGSAQLSVRSGALTLPGVFEEPRIPLDELAANIRWQVQGARIEVQTDDLRLANPDASGRFKARWHSGEAADGSGPRFPGMLDLQGNLARANAARVHRYLPFSVPAEARHYVRDAILKGDGRNVAVRVQGRLREFPYNLPGEVGEFRIAGPVSGLVMDYVPQRLQPKGQPPWPALEALGGELIFERAGMRVREAAARVHGQPQWRFARIRAEIADFKRPRVLVQGEGSGPLATALAIVRQSPLAGFTGHALDQASATGDAALELKLELPIEALEKARVQGRVRLQGNGMQLAADVPPLEQVQGAVSFSDSGFAIEDARAKALGGSARLSGGSVNSPAIGAPSVEIQVRGSASAEGLRQMAGHGTAWNLVGALARQGSGSTDYAAAVGFRGDAPSVRVDSSLRGLTLDLPAPLDKPVDAAWPMRFESGPLAGADNAGREMLRLRVGERLALDYELAAGTPAQVRRGAIGIGPAVASSLALPASGVQARLQTPLLDLDAWQRTLQAFTQGTAGAGATAPDAVGAGYLPSRWSIQVQTLRWDERVLHDVTAAGLREGPLWRTQIQSRELAGRIDYTEGANGRAGAVHARLARLMIAREEEGRESTLEQPPTRIPALDVVVDEFELNGKKLGRLELQAVNRDVRAPRAAAAPVQEWQLERLALTTPEASLAASGRWAAAAQPPPGGTERRHTTLDFKLDIRDGGALLARFGMPGVVRGGKGGIEGKLGWAASPFAPHYPSMDGQLHLDVGAGQFLKADPGVAKLLGVLSLQALPRRLTLDFRDVFSTGFAFDFVRGDAQVERGVLATHNLQMKGVNAAVLMDGKVDLAKETQDLRVVVVPEFDAGAVALATALINPVIGLSAFLAQLVLKQPIIRAATREFQVTGRWDHPEIAPVAANKPEPNQ